MTDKGAGSWWTSGLIGAQNPWRNWLIVVLFYAVALAMLFGHLRIWPQQFQVGQVVPYTIFAPVTFEYEDSAKLAELTGNVGEGEPYSFVDTAKRDQALARFTSFKQDFFELRQALAKQEPADSESGSRIANLGRQYGVHETIISSFLNYQDDRLNHVFSSAEQLLDEAMQQPITAAYVRSIKQGGIPELLITPENIYTYFLTANLEQYSPPNLHAERKQLARVVIEKGSVIIVEGAVVDTRVHEQLQELWPHLLKQGMFRFLGLALVLLAAMLWWYLYLQRFARQLAENGSLTQIGMLFLLFLAIGLVLGRLPFNYFYYATAFAVVALTTVVVLVYDSIFALYLGLGLGLVLSVALSFGADLMLYTLAGALLPTVFIAPGSSRRHQVWFCFAIALVNVVLAATVVLISVQTLHWEVFVIAGLAGFAAAVMALGLLPVVETLTAQLTPNKLVELANPENELLRRLKREAHGTYVHSEMVADLSEEACKEIGCNWLLAKVGALYHDIGKLKRPGFFAENIHDLGKNPHQGLPPETSVKILRDHVSDGLEMAREARLPQGLHQFIAEHHGNYLIRFFYFKAQQMHEEQPDERALPRPEDYRYQGPIPQNRESGVVMLADVTEAVVRARGIVDTEEIEAVVAKIVADKLEEEQLVDSGLTIGDLQQVKRAFCRILVAQRHSRIRYPEERAAPVQFHYAEQNGIRPPSPAGAATASDSSGDR